MEKPEGESSKAKEITPAETPLIQYLRERYQVAIDP